MEEIVKYNNEFNQVCMRDFTAAEIDVFMTLCAKVKENECRKVTMDLRELKQLSEYQKNGIENFRMFILNLNRKIQSISYEISSGSKTIQFVLFPYFETDISNMTLTVAVNPEFAFLLNDFAFGNWTKFYLKEITTLRSKYSKNLHRCLRQYTRFGWWQTSLREIRNRLGIPESSNSKNLFSKYIGPAIKELVHKAYYKHIKCIPIKSSDQSHKIEGYRFEFETTGLKSQEL